MKKATGLFVALVIFALAGAFTPVPLAHAGTCYYRCDDFTFWSRGDWGMGANCDEARNQGIVNSQNWAYTQCDVCWFGAVEEVTLCTCHDGMCKGDWRIEYRCLVLDYCEDDPPIEI